MPFGFINQVKRMGQCLYSAWVLLVLDCPQPDRFNLGKKNYHFAKKKENSIMF